jgi:hypothetical protein
MKTAAIIRTVAALLAVASLVSCEIHQRTIREYRAGPEGTVSVVNVTEDEYWKGQVDQRIAAELEGKKPEAHETWQAYYQWWYSVLRRKSKPAWKSKEFETSESLVTYIKERRRSKGLPAYED